MSIKELLTDCYLYDKHIHIDLEISKIIQLEDVFTIIYLVSDKKAILTLDYDLLELIDTDGMVIDNEDHHLPILDISRKIKNPDIIIMLYIAFQDLFHYDPVPFCGDERFEYKNKEYFIKLAKDASMIDYFVIRQIMMVLDIHYYPETEGAELFTKSHLGLLNNTKSARNI